MRHADILKLHYQYAFARLNPGKPVVLPPNGFGARALPAPTAANTPESAPTVPPPVNPNNRAWAYASSRPVPNGAHFETETPRSAAPFVVEAPKIIQPAPTMRARRVVNRVEAEGVDLASPQRDVYHRTYAEAGYDVATPAHAGVGVESHEAPLAATTPGDVFAKAKASREKTKTSRLRSDRQKMMVAAAIALGIGGTVYFVHPDIRAIAIAWSTYRAAANPDGAKNEGRPARSNVIAASPMSASGLGGSVQPTDTYRSVGANVLPTGNSSRITIPMTPAEPPHALTSHDFVEDVEKGSPLSNVSPEALRTHASDPAAQGVAEVTVPAAPVNVFNAPIRRILPILHHSAPRANPPAPVRPRDVRSGEAVNQARDTHPDAPTAAIPAVSDAPAQPAQPAKSQDANSGDQKLF
jgi:hypothetical protein